MQNDRANVKVLKFLIFCIFSCILTLLIILIKPLRSKAYDRCASGYCGTPGTVDGFILVGPNFCGLNENDTFVGFKICGYIIFLHNSYKKLLICRYLKSWVGPSTKTTKIGPHEKLSHPQYFFQPRLILIWSKFKYCLLFARNTLSSVSPSICQIVPVFFY